MWAALLLRELTTWPARRSSRDALFSAVRCVERRLLQELAAANRRRLLDFCCALQVGIMLLTYSPLAGFEAERRERGLNALSGLSSCAG